MNAPYIHRSSGQLALGLAFAFAGALAVLGLVSHSSMDVKEKITLQQTTDYAVLLAANVQRANLNMIRTLNQDIETLWEAHRVLLQAPHCYTREYIYPKTPSAFATFALVAAHTGKTYAECDLACDEYDSFVRKKIIDAYNSQRNLIVSNILTSITKSNQIAYGRAVDTFLTPSNLPSQLYAELEKKLGKNFRLQDVKNEYAQGSLYQDRNVENSEGYIYQIHEESSYDPLFVPGDEYRNFIYPNYRYLTLYDQNLNPYCQLGTPEGPKSSASRVKIVRKGSYTTHFLGGINYLAPPSGFEKTLSLLIKDPETGEEISSQSGRKIALFRKTLAMTAMAAAKPYGGTFPQSGDLAGLNKGNIGEEFKGAKLIGIADRSQLENQRMVRADNCFQSLDALGNSSGCVPYYAEDFLH
ncbi:MAG: hypothetical protein KDD52_03375 [Bdellovibrionales bacterium]|nr:hypothetical protein [Bdellovibrionales bacterium]